MSSDNPSSAALADDLAFALRLADAADEVSMRRFDAPDLDVQLKADASHVTEADLATEKALRELLALHRPDDGILGEEFGTEGSTARQWILDPIDGTANYLKGIPMWATLIALAVDGVPVLGVVSQPALGRRWWGGDGLGAWTTQAGDASARPIHVSDTDRLDAASISFQSIAQWDDAGYLPALTRLSRTVWRDRGYGDAWPYMLLAEGRLEMVAEFGVKEYDVAAHIPIIRAAGGRFTDINGLEAIDTRSSLATNGVLHEDLLHLIHGADKTT